MKQKPTSRLKGGIVLCTLLFLVLLSATPQIPRVHATGLSWLMEPGATATYRHGPLLEGELQRGSIRFNITESDGVRVSVRRESYEPGSGWYHTGTYVGLAIDLTCTFWMQPNATVGDSVHEILGGVNRPIANMERTVHDGDHTGAGTMQDALEVQLGSINPTWDISYIVYDSDCFLALHFYWNPIYYHLYETNIDLGPNTNETAVSNLLTVLLLAIGIATIVILTVCGVRALLRRRRSN